MKKISLFLLCGAMAFGFSACEKEVKPLNGTENGHEYIDLGLSVKWATCNVGATKPEEGGDYFAWGETEAGTLYSWSAYDWYDGESDHLSKYCTFNSYGQVDGKKLLDAADDAANVVWGGAWRMPTLAELQELIDNCTWTWTTRNEVNGYEVKAKNGNSIFLPAAGYFDDEDVYEVSVYGSYWTASLDAGNPFSSFSLSFDSNYFDWGSYDRCDGQCIRAVKP